LQSQSHGAASCTNVDAACNQVTSDCIPACQTVHVCAGARAL
jgi:hypothetical protein